METKKKKWTTTKVIAVGYVLVIVIGTIFSCCLYLSEIMSQRLLWTPGLLQPLPPV